MSRIKFLSILLFVAFGSAAYFYAPSRTSARSFAGGEVPAAPTGVIASDSAFINKVSLHWDAIRGATLYRILRNTTNNSGTATDVGSTAAAFFFDTTGAVGQSYFYWVRAENNAGVSTLGASDQGTRAAGSITGGSFTPLDPPYQSAENPITAAKAYLGKTLFWDEQLSSTRTVACGTCHRSSAGGSDPRTVNTALSRNPGPDNTFNTIDDIFGSRGVVQNNADASYTLNPLFGLNEQVTNRKAPSYLNAAYSGSGIFWDGRATDEFRDPVTDQLLIPGLASLESQVKFPPVASGEMGHTGRDWPQAASRIQDVTPLALASNIPTALKTWIHGRTYPQLFDEAFGTPDVTPARIAMAIATHERGLFSDETPLDKASANIQPLTFQENSGMNVFISRQCDACHISSLLTDQGFHNIGVRPASEDLGRGAVTGLSTDNGAFKTPNLRNLELRAPYMHNGRFATLEEVVEFYDRGGDFPNEPNVDHDFIRPLNLSVGEKADLVAFLKRPLTDLRVKNELPPFDRPQLFTESDRVPVVSGTGSAGGGFTPEPIVNSPALIGNPGFTVAVRSGLGGAQAYLAIDAVDPGIGSSIPASASFAYRTQTLSGSGAGNGYTSVVLTIPNQQNLVGRTFYGRWYVTDPSAVNGFSVSRLFSFKVFSANSSTPRNAQFDYDGDGKTDASVYRPSNNAWYLLRSTDGFAAYQFGATGDSVVPADYTGDGKTDVAIWRPSNGTWYILRSEDLTVTGGPFGTVGDTAAPGDYDGDGKADLAVYRPGALSTFYVQESTNGFVAFSFGVTGDKPTLGDFDGDGKTDFAVYRPSQGAWYRFNSSNNGFYAVQFGQAGDKVVPADYTGDGKTDVAVWREPTGTWYVLKSEDLQTVTGGGFGSPGDIPAPGDFDGDGKTDFAVYRPGAQGVFYTLQTTNGFTVIPWGLAGDIPTPNAYVK